MCTTTRTAQVVLHLSEGGHHAVRDTGSGQLECILYVSRSHLFHKADGEIEHVGMSHHGEQVQNKLRASQPGQTPRKQKNSRAKNKIGTRLMYIVYMIKTYIYNSTTNRAPAKHGGKIKSAISGDRRQRPRSFESVFCSVYIVHYVNTKQGRDRSSTSTKTTYLSLKS